MSDLRVSTYETGPSGLHFLGRQSSLAASAAELPEGAYTTLRTYGGRRVLRLGQHLRRLEESAALRARPGAIDPAAARRALASALDTATSPESRLRLTFAPPRLFVAIEPFSVLPKQLYEEGVACVTLDLRRDNPHAKDTRFIATAQAAYGRLPAGAEEGLIVGEDGAVLEGLSSNLFAVVGGTLRTEEERVLIGVTRSVVLELAERLMPVDRRAVLREDLPRVDEVFLTSVSREVLPVARIDGQPVGDGRVGPSTLAVMGAFADLVRREAEPL
jgi:branched-subunit amino acid aminotransferase/4-amino-4-deoxychorismate lyase